MRATFSYSTQFPSPCAFVFDCENRVLECRPVRFRSHENPSSTNVHDAESRKSSCLAAFRTAMTAGCCNLRSAEMA